MPTWPEIFNKIQKRFPRVRGGESIYLLLGNSLPPTNNSGNELGEKFWRAIYSLNESFYMQTSFRDELYVIDGLIYEIF